MCYLCVEVIKEKLTPNEFWRNYDEMDVEDEHIPEIIEAVMTTTQEYQDAINKHAFRKVGKFGMQRNEDDCE